MKRLPRLLTALTILAAATALAALPPQHQRAAELSAIVGSIEIIDLFLAEGLYIDGINRVDDDVYLVTGGSCELTVIIADVPAPEGELPMVGARQFELQLGELSCS